ncbi:Uncharacterized deoxyribonuclease YcfH,putative DNAse,Mg-dependent DNase,hydrolase, TatD family,TatD related DNase [Chlamydia serpentis]|uniref:Uncharacterized deoxyribonuclease YcfH,putative DNAse,Mg-dependent DNase,hydrolase, TatD family,TatD related DNase n=1 Tax=Chlamydia serpentis TaxID=1967782 RepID=A0A2R8FC23_9CHLA|nr:TatD family hydrolase [Chlamydia serpentis]SPN73901.1 Uncharacterized deoxyribonuclease YcfH,putative DNAse,Mg-dependent DNase,hydrolase, TatD family,TatD related DNase [Chlamydia serpentis]
MNLADAHVHLSDDAFCQDIDAVLQRAQDCGISLVVNVTTTEEELSRSFTYAERFSNIRFCHVGGTPPQDVDQDIEQNFKTFHAAAHSKKLAAIGEVGLDYYFAVTEEGVARQKKVLQRYLDLSLEYQLPLVVHCRGAFSDFFSMLSQHYHNDSRACPGMLHCFTGTLEEAQELISWGWFISISGIVTFKNAEDLRDLVIQLPLEHLLIETDAPFLSPVPHRGKKNEPAHVIHTMDIIANLKGITSQELAAIAYENVLRFLRC